MKSFVLMFASVLSLGVADKVLAPHGLGPVGRGPPGPTGRSILFRLQGRPGKRPGGFPGTGGHPQELAGLGHPHRQPVGFTSQGTSPGTGIGVGHGIGHPQGPSVGINIHGHGGGSLIDSHSGPSHIPLGKGQVGINGHGHGGLNGLGGHAAPHGQTASGPEKHGVLPKIVPHCARNISYSFCLEDYEYPEHPLQEAIQKFAEKFNQLYADVADQSTKDSVQKLKYIEEETYLCASDTIYIKPKRARNAEGKWKIIVNLEKGYQKYSQTVRIEKCLDLLRGKHCPLVPECYESRCVQKSFYHRFLTFDPYNKYNPFTIDIFPLPGSCSCFVGSYIQHHQQASYHDQPRTKSIPTTGGAAYA